MIDALIIYERARLVNPVCRCRWGGTFVFERGKGTVCQSFQLKLVTESLCLLGLLTYLKNLLTSCALCYLLVSISLRNSWAKGAQEAITNKAPLMAGPRIKPATRWVE